MSERYIAYDDGFSKNFLIPAGESALAEVSELAEPANPVFAIDRKAWRELMASGLKLAAVHDIDTVEIEVWRYPPRPVSDPIGGLSVWLSLAENGNDDPRMEDALESLLEKMERAAHRR